MIEAILSDRSLEQLINVPNLPGIEKGAFAMPDVHEGFAWCNREIITYEVRCAFQKALGIPGKEIKLLYDVTHTHC